MWVYVIKSKDQAYSVFKRFKLEAETVNGSHVKTLRTDQGGEFLSRDFNKFC